APWINDVVPTSDDDDKNTEATTPNTSRNARRPYFYDSANGVEEDCDGDTDSSPWSQAPVRRWSKSPRQRRGRDRWAPWRGASPKSSPRGSKRHQARYSPRFSPNGARRYYDQSYHGRVAPQYDPYFYQQRGSGVGPHRTAPRWARQNQYEQTTQGRPRQYRGPRPYRSPAAHEEPPQVEEQQPKTPTGDKIHPSLPRTPYWSPEGPEGPKRHTLSPGAKDNVFSPVTPKRRSARWNPY
ncbi:putative serine/arginine-rich splicing factor SR45-like 1, partial [Homarus americanus]